MENSKRIIQIEPKNVLPLLCNGVTVYSFNLGRERVDNLEDYQIKSIQSGIDKGVYLYFIVDEEEDD